ncbi:MAG: site-specific integrase, partial [Firmicutes bacterium]|nr:site-specific integrase [Bacillota bacterium]
REALDWERTFLEKQQADLTMVFSSMVELYIEDMAHRLRESTIKGKRLYFENKINPYFGKMPVSQIKPTDIRQWQNDLINYRDDKDKPYSPTYLRSIHTQLSAAFNYAVRYYGLRENPCHKAGTIGKLHADKMEFWTIDEFRTFIAFFEDKPHIEVAFMLLYFTGLRLGEMLALTVDDIDLTGGFIAVSKSKQRINKIDVITEPKTPKSNRVVTIPQFFCDKLSLYIETLYGYNKESLIFPYSKGFYTLEMSKGSKATGVKKIRLHDLRHSHASLLINEGFSPLLIAERLGHEKVETTLNTYGHLYPNKHSEVAEKLEAFRL